MSYQDLKKQKQTKTLNIPKNWRWTRPTDKGRYVQSAEKGLNLTKQNQTGLMSSLIRLIAVRTGSICKTKNKLYKTGFVLFLLCFIAFGDLHPNQQLSFISGSFLGPGNLQFLVSSLIFVRSVLCDAIISFCGSSTLQYLLIYFGYNRQYGPA